MLLFQLWNKLVTSLLRTRIIDSMLIKKKKVEELGLTNTPLAWGICQHSCNCTYVCVNLYAFPTFEF